MINDHVHLIDKWSLIMIYDDNLDNDGDDVDDNDNDDVDDDQRASRLSGAPSRGTGRRMRGAANENLAIKLKQ